ncbi:MAG: LysM peptidoglycan-binding domain-containing protein [Desulfuromonadaceae bacterium]
MSRTFFILISVCFIICACAPPPRQELEAARLAISKARASGAPELAPGKFQTALEVMENGEVLFARGQYHLAQETLPYAEALAQQAIHAAREEQARRDAEAALKKEKLEQLKQQLKAEYRRPREPKPTVIAKPTPSQPRQQTPPPSPPPVTRYTVGNGETLWSISAQKTIYQDAFLWPLIYRANRDQIKDPKQIYPGQELNIPRNLKESDLMEARATAHKSDLFPLDLLMKASSEDNP